MALSGGAFGCTRCYSKEKALNFIDFQLSLTIRGDESDLSDVKDDNLTSIHGFVVPISSREFTEFI